MKVLSLFDGISCARVALERVGFDIERYLASEVDKYAIQISSKNFPNIEQIGDVKELDLITYPFRDSIDLLIGGSRCQDLSIAKKNGKTNNLTTFPTQESLILQDSIIRKLTPIECERLQGLPDNYTDGVSNSQRYKMLGNAFNVDVVAHILSFIPKQL